MDSNLTRRNFLQKSVAAGAGMVALNPMSAWAKPKHQEMKLGLVTYQWAKDWDLKTLIANCEKTGVLGVELRTEHAHKVEINLNADQRREVKKIFHDSPVTCLGYGSNFEYHHPDPIKLRWNIDQTKEYIKLCKDIGASGIKVKPNGIPDGIAKEKTFAQIASSLNEVGKYAQDFGLTIRVEVHGNKSQELPNMKAIFDQVSEKNVKMCWNCNDQDLLEPGLEANFNSVKRWFGDTVHVRELNIGDYPYAQLFKLFHQMHYGGWILMEARTNPLDKVAALKEQLEVFNQLVAQSK